MTCVRTGRGVATAAMLFVALIGHAAAESMDPRYQAIRDLGALNGVALQCRHIGEVRRMKAAVVAHAPKERSFGLAFDEATNEAFLAFIRERASCPGPEQMALRVGHAIDALAVAFR